MTEELKRSDAFSLTTCKITPKTIIPSNSNYMQIGVSQCRADFTTVCQCGQTIRFKQVHCSQLIGAFS